MQGTSSVELVLRFREDHSFQHQHLLRDVVCHDTVMLSFVQIGVIQLFQKGALLQRVGDLLVHVHLELGAKRGGTR